MASLAFQRPLYCIVRYRHSNNPTYLVPLLLYWYCFLLLDHNTPTIHRKNSLIWFMVSGDLVHSLLSLKNGREKMLSLWWRGSRAREQSQRRSKWPSVFPKVMLPWAAQTYPESPRRIPSQAEWNNQDNASKLSYWKLIKHVCFWAYFWAFYSIPLICFCCFFVSVLLFWIL